MGVTQQTETIQTHLEVALVEDHLNEWTPVAGTADLNCEVLYSYPPSSSPFEYEQTYWGYRGQAAMLQLKDDLSTFFDGVNDGITFGDNYDFIGPGTAMSAWGWIFPYSGMGVGAHVVMGKLLATDGWFVSYATANGLSFVRRSGSTDDTAVSGVISEDTWSFWAVTYDGANMRIYIDGVLKDTTASIKNLPGNTQNLTLGKNSGGASNFFMGYMYGVGVANSALTATALTNLPAAPYFSAYWHQVNGAVPATKSLWLLSENSGTYSDQFGGLVGTRVGSITGGTAEVPLIAKSGSIIRVRIGDGTAADRKVYIQRVNYPTLGSQWNTWTQLYTGDNYAVEIYPDTVSNGYHVVHSKSDGIYVDGVKTVTQTKVIKVRKIAASPGAGIYFTVDQDDLDNEISMEEWEHTDFEGGGAGSYSKMNYRYRRMETCSIRYTIGATGYYTTFHSLAYSAPSVRSDAVSDDLVSETGLTSVFSNDIGLLRPIRGASGRAGIKSIERLWISDDINMPLDRAYLFFTEKHVDQYGNYLSNLHSPAFFMQTSDFTGGMTEPQPLGFSIWGFAGCVWYADKLYIAGNGGAWYRTAEQTETDLSNYAMSASLSIPRDNQKATGTITLANPDDVLGDMLGMTTDALSTAPEKRITVKICQKRSDVLDWEDAEIDDWWIAEAHRINEDDTRRVELKLEDFWHRLENPFRDPYYFPGHLVHHDWDTDGPQTLLNYYTPTGAMSLVADTDAEGAAFNHIKVSKGFLLYTAWKGAHGQLTCRFTVPTTQAMAVVFRWVDEKNYYRSLYSGTTLKLQQIVNGVPTTLDTQTVSAGFTTVLLEVRFRFGWIRTYFNNTLMTEHQELTTGRVDQYGFVGTWAKGNNAEYERFFFEDYDAAFSTSSLIKYLLIYSGYLQYEVDDDLEDVNQLAVAWGPQTDVPTPSKALEKLIEGNFQHVAWTQYVAADSRGQINIKQFDAPTVAYEIEEEIISVDQADVSEKRPNVFSVDGLEDSWTEYYKADLATRGGTVNAYYDLPELLTLTKVRAKAQEQKTASVRGNSLGGIVVWRPWFKRMDTVTWIDHDGKTYTARIEGMDITVDQGVEPFQRVQMDLTPTALCDPEEDSVPPPFTPLDYLAQDDFLRPAVASSWGSAVVGGAWTTSGTAADFDLDDINGVITPGAVSSDRLAYLAIASTASMYINVACVMAVMPPVSASSYIYVLFRVINSTNFYYARLRIFKDDGHVTIDVIKRVAGVDTIIVATRTIVGLSVYFTSYLHIKIWVSGTSPTKFAVKVWKANTEPQEYTVEGFDSQAALQAAGGVGVGMRLSGDSTAPLSQVKFAYFNARVGPTENPL